MFIPLTFMDFINQLDFSLLFVLETMVTKTNRKGESPHQTHSNINQGNDMTKRRLGVVGRVKLKIGEVALYTDISN